MYMKEFFVYSYVLYKNKHFECQNHMVLCTQSHLRVFGTNKSLYSGERIKINNYCVFSNILMI